MGIFLEALKGADKIVHELSVQRAESQFAVNLVIGKE
jgi:hypothetical protein